MKVVVPLRAGTGQSDRECPATPITSASTKALALIVATRPDTNGRWAAELRSVEVLDFYRVAA